MKNHLLLLITLLFLQGIAHAQKLYVKAAGSYSIAASPQQYNTSYNYYFDDFGLTKEDYTVEKGSFGAGTRGSLSLGTMLTHNFGVEVEASYQKGRRLPSFYNMFVKEFSDKAATTSYSRMLAIAPSFLVTTTGKQINPYAKAGVIISKPKIIQETNRVNTQGAQPPGQIYTQEFEITGKTAVGFQGGLGANFRVADSFSLFSEITFASLSFTPVTGKTTTYQVDGEDYRDYVTESFKTTQYVNSFTGQDNTDPNQPHKAFNSPLPFNFIGVQIGLQVNIFHK